MYRAAVQRGYLIEYVPTKFITEDFINTFTDKHLFSEIIYRRLDAYGYPIDDESEDYMYAKLFVEKKITFDEILDYIIYDSNFVELTVMWPECIILIKL